MVPAVKPMAQSPLATTKFDLIFSLCQSASLEPKKEPSNLLRNCGLRPADVSINYHMGITWALDVAVVDPIRSDLVHLSWNPIIAIVMNMESTSKMLSILI
jgi:hypothetical protein